MTTDVALSLDERDLILLAEILARFTSEIGAVIPPLLTPTTTPELFPQKQTQESQSTELVQPRANPMCRRLVYGNLNRGRSSRSTRHSTRQAVVLFSIGFSLIASCSRVTMRSMHG
jgi:hypothetical protein